MILFNRKLDILSFIGLSSFLINKIICLLFSKKYTIQYKIGVRKKIDKPIKLKKITKKTES